MRPRTSSARAGGDEEKEISVTGNVKEGKLSEKTIVGENGEEKEKVSAKWEHCE